MTDDEIKTLFLRELHKIAPEVEQSEIDPAIDLREQIDLDSMDILNLADRDPRGDGSRYSGSGLSADGEFERLRRVSAVAHQLVKTPA